MNTIIELIEKTRVLIFRSSPNDEIFDNLVDEVKPEHKRQIIAAYNRGRASMMGAFMMSAEEYYEKNYGEDK